MMMSKTIPIYLGLACLVLESFVGLVVLLGASERASDFAETQQQHATPLTVVAMPTTGRLLFRIPAIDEVAPASSNNDDDNNKAIDATTTPVAVAQEPSYVLQEGTRRRLLLRLPSDPLTVWAVDKVALYSFVRDDEAAHTVTWKSDFTWQPTECLILPLTSDGRVLFRMPSSLDLVDSVDEHVLLKFLEDHKAATMIAYGDYDDYKQDGYYDDYEQWRHEELQSATAVHDADDAADSNSNTEEPTVQADETCGDDDTNATETTRLEILRIAIYRIAVYCLVGFFSNAIYRIAEICFLWFFSTWNGFLTGKRDFTVQQRAPVW